MDNFLFSIFNFRLPDNATDAFEKSRSDFLHKPGLLAVQ
jgi:hypothetical protein